NTRSPPPTGASLREHRGQEAGDSDRGCDGLENERNGGREDKFLSGLLRRPAGRPIRIPTFSGCAPGSRLSRSTPGPPWSIRPPIPVLRGVEAEPPHDVTVSWGALTPSPSPGRHQDGALTTPSPVRLDRSDTPRWALRLRRALRLAPGLILAWTLATLL